MTVADCVCSEPKPTQVFNIHEESAVGRAAPGDPVEFVTVKALRAMIDRLRSYDAAPDWMDNHTAIELGDLALELRGLEP